MYKILKQEHQNARKERGPTENLSVPNAANPSSHNRICKFMIGYIQAFVLSAVISVARGSVSASIYRLMSEIILVRDHMHALYVLRNLPRPVICGCTKSDTQNRNNTAVVFAGKNTLRAHHYPHTSNTYISSPYNKTCHRDRIARLTVPCPLHKKL